MTRLPLTLKLRRQAHRRIAAAQDTIVKEVYDVFNRAVLHGGTAIWRCYGGSRFSEDVDFYLQRNLKELDAVFRRLVASGFVVNERKIGEYGLFSVLDLNGTIVRFEALFKSPVPGGILADYETSDGNLISVYALSAEDLVKEKVAAYLGRRKVRDLYDIFFLLRHVKESRVLSAELEKLTKAFRNPVDEAELPILVIEGIIPKTEDMLDYIKRKI